MIKAKNTQKKSGAVLVVGGGIAGIQSALDLANSGFKVYLAEESPVVGGNMSRLDKTFPTNDCSMCILSPKLVEVGRHRNIEIITNARLEELTGSPGNFRAVIRQYPRYVSLDQCTGCDECTKVCPVEMPNEYEEGLVNRKAIYRPYPQAIPNIFAIDKRGIPPCRGTCPVNVNVQGYIALIRQGEYEKAVALHRRRNPFPAISSRVCHHPCETNCIRGEVDEPISIRSLKRFMADRVKNRYPEDQPKKNGVKVGIVGSGPAGLTAAYFLARDGYQVTVYEALPVIGGMLRVGIPDYRLPPQVIEDELKPLRNLGVVFRTGVKVGKDITLRELKKKHRAVFIATGCHISKPMSIPGENLKGVLGGVEFLKKINLGGKLKLGGQVAVVGGGNAAIDSARTALRLGAGKVTIFYRRTRYEMPAAPEEIAEALKEGIEIEYLTLPVEIIGQGGRVTSLKCIRMKLGEEDESGRRRPLPIEGSEFTVGVSSVIEAIGQKPDLAFAGGLEIHPRWGTLAADPETMLTSRKGVFAGGDAVRGPDTFIWAISDGRKAYLAIDSYLKGKKIAPVLAADSEEPDELTVETDTVETAGRAEERTLPLKKRKQGFAEVELGLSKEKALSEAGRCLNCGGCSECLACVEVCEPNAIDHAQREDKLRELEVGAVIVSPGSEHFNPAEQHFYGYHRFSNVLSNIQFERMLSASGPTEGHIVRPSDRREPLKVAFLQCIGSRDTSCGNDYCSAVCCMAAIKEAIIAKEHAPGIEPAIFFLDMRAYGKDFDRYYEKAASEYGIRFIRSRVSGIEEEADSQNLFLTHLDDRGEVKREEFDLVILSAGLTAHRKHIDLARRTELRLDRFGFIDTIPLSPHQTYRPGVLTAGTASGPRDIPETVSQASGAAGEAAEMLSESRGSEIAPLTYPRERNVTGEEPRVGVFICNCGINIGGVVNVPEVVEYAGTLPHVAYLDENLFTCSQDTQENIKQAIEEHKLNRVVVASCSPRTHEPLFQQTLKEAGLNPGLFEMANIRDQCSWIHMLEPEEATGKAKDLVRMSVAKAALLEPLREVSLDVIQKAVVIGGGLAGMVSALSLADQGFEVSLIEREKKLGGNLQKIYFTPEGKDIRKFLDSLIERAKKHRLLKIYTGAGIADIEGYIGNYKLTVNVKGRKSPLKLDSGVIIVAIGGEETKPKEYLYGEDKRVITQTELEKQLANPKSEIRKPKTVVMIQCVGSRDNEHPYCSRVCCTEAVKNALALKERDPETEIYILFRDVRTYGFSEKYYRQARRQGVVFIRYEKDEKPSVKKTEKKLQVDVRDLILDKNLRIDADLLVLAPAIAPQKDAEKLARMLKVPLNQDGFFLEAHAKLRPVDFSTEGVFLAGLAHSPKSISESISQAKAAAARAATIISRDNYLAAPIVAAVDEDLCAGCGLCVSVCSYDGPELVEIEGGKKVSRVNVALCKGCGSCAAACPSGAMQQLGFKSAQTREMVRAALEAE